MRVAIAAILLAFLGSSALALVKDGRGVPALASTPPAAADSAASASASNANASSAAAPSTTASASPIINSLEASAESKLADPLSSAALSIAPAVTEPAQGNQF